MTDGPEFRTAGHPSRVAFNMLAYHFFKSSGYPVGKNLSRS